MYNFRLQRILDFKEKEEENKKNEVSKINAKIIEKKNEKLELEKELEEISNERNKKEKEFASINDILSINQYISVLNDKIAFKKIEIDQLKDQLEIKKEEYIDSRKKKKTYENLKEKDYKRFLKEESKKEVEIIDEIVTFKSRKI